MKCPKCQTIAMPEDQFCGSCGAGIRQKRSTDIKQVMQSAVATHASLNSAYLHHRLGMVYYRQAKLEDAIESWTRALELDPANDEARKMLDRATLEMQIAVGG